MSAFSSNIHFKYPWRKYQQRVLDELESHLGDGHLHVVAPPGSGKTVLGLEVMLRIGKPTLILAPTIAIRDQWVQRFCELFLQIEKVPDWISKDVRNPKLITVSTYQGLHAACNRLEEEVLDVDYEDETDVDETRKSNFLNINHIVQLLQQVGIKAMVLDEAHHLKNEWWKTLVQLKTKLQSTIVGLTATPPYDVSPQEWVRYLDLLGPIDAEISVPELIQSGDLCYHQDYVYLCEPDSTVQQELHSFKEAVEVLCAQLLSDAVLFEAIAHHPIWLEPKSHEDLIYQNLASYSSCLIYLHHQGLAVFPSHLEMLGLEPLKKKEVVEDKIKLPALNKEWLAELLMFYLFEEKGFFEKNYDLHRKKVERQLRRLGVLEYKRIRFDYNERISQHLMTSVTKLQAIENIALAESTSLGQGLRQVILADYIRKEFMAQGECNELSLTRIGVMSIFEQLRRQPKLTRKIAVLTGSLVIIHQFAKNALDRLIELYPFANIRYQPLRYDSNYLEVAIDEKAKGLLLQSVTNIFEQGEIEILIGTKSLLGEGWDAPSINSLLLASFVGSFVLSNQMRGRAIRSLKGFPDKTSNIWHIVAVDAFAKNGGQDLAIMKRRFRNFVGVSEYELPNIENGKKRLVLPESYTTESIQNYNSSIAALAKDRDRLAKKWQAAIGEGVAMIEEIVVPFQEERSFSEAKYASMKKYVGNLVAGVGSAITFFLETSTNVLSKLMKIVPGQPIGYAFLAMFGVATVFYGRRTVVALGNYKKYRDITKDIYGIGNALLKSLCKTKIFTSNLEQFNVLTFADAEGNVFCHLDGGTTFEKSVFIQMIQEIINPIVDPRYIIIRKSKLVNLFEQRDYHAVPELLGKKKSWAEDFFQFWKEEVGDAELYFTKSMEGRKVLLRSKFHALSNTFSEDRSVQEISVWK